MGIKMHGSCPGGGGSKNPNDSNVSTTSPPEPITSIAKESCGRIKRRTVISFVVFRFQLLPVLI